MITMNILLGFTFAIFCSVKKCCSVCSSPLPNLVVGGHLEAVLSGGNDGCDRLLVAYAYFLLLALRYCISILLSCPLDSGIYAAQIELFIKAVMLSLSFIVELELPNRYRDGQTANLGSGLCYLGSVG